MLLYKTVSNIIVTFTCSQYTNIEMLLYKTVINIIVTFTCSRYTNIEMLLYKTDIRHIHGVQERTLIPYQILLIIT